MPVSDSLVLAAKCNCVILVVRAGVTNREVVHMARERLIKFDAVIAGAILNGAEPYFNANYYSGYGPYYAGKQPSKILKYLTS
jgi:Mrp family chromosome partitioning ATPase